MRRFLEVFGGYLCKPPQTSDLRKPPETSDLEVCRGFQKFPEVSVRRLLEVVGGLQRFPEVSGGLRKEVCRGLQRFPEVFRGLQRFAEVISQTSANLLKPPQTHANLRRFTMTFFRGLRRFDEVCGGLRHRFSEVYGGLSEVLRGFRRFEKKMCRTKNPPWQPPESSANL